MNDIRIQLERKIADAADGQLSDAEILQLEAELQQYPDLLQDYEEIMSQPDLANLYGEVEDISSFSFQIESINQAISKYNREHQSFEEVTIYWFKRYAVAASIGILVLASVFNLSAGSSGQYDDTQVISEMLYPNQQSDVDDYVLYLEEISNQ